MAQDNTISIRLAGMKPIILKVGSQAAADAYREAEEMLNKEWVKYEARYRSSQTSSAEIMAMVAFKFAWASLTSSRLNESVNALLKEFEEKLDGIVVNVKQP